MVAIKGHDVRFWPLVGWPMYASFHPHFPLTQPASDEVRVHDADGRIHRFRPPDLFPLEWNNVAETLVRRAFADPGHPSAQRALTGVVRRRLPPGAAPITRVEGWRLEWDVPVFRLPLLDPERPGREVRVGSFAVPPCRPAEGCSP